MLACFLALALGSPVLAQDSAPDRSMVSGLPLTDAQRKLTPEVLGLDIWVDPDAQRIRGNAKYRFESEPGARLVELELDQRFTVSAVTIDNTRLAVGQWSHEDGLLSIQLTDSAAKRQKFTAEIAYGGAPRVAPNAPWDGGFVWAKTPSGEPWIATAMQMHGCDLLYPCIDHSWKEIGFVDSTIWVPSASKLYAAGNGKFVGVKEEGAWRGYKWSARKPNIYAIALNIAPYEIIERSHVAPSGQKVPLVFYHLPGDGKQAAHLLDELAKYLDWFERRIGPYPFGGEKAGIAQTPHLGMEHQTINAYGNRFRVTTEPYDWLLFHEFAHEWFANQLTHRNVADMWLHEGMASYTEALYLRDIAGMNAYHAKLDDYRRRIGNMVAVAPRRTLDGSAYLAPDGWGTDIYFKGSWILHTLRELIGDEAFFASLTRLVYDQDAPEPGRFSTQLRDTDEFLAILEEKSSRKLGWFFEAYLRQPALPKLITNRDGRFLELEWELPGDIEFPMPVEVRVGERILVAEFTGNRAGLDLGDEDAIVTIDPNSKILRDNPQINAWQASQGRR